MSNPYDIENQWSPVCKRVPTQKPMDMTYLPSHVDSTLPTIAWDKPQVYPQLLG